MQRAGVRVMAVKLGLIDTPMTYGLRTRVPIASPESTASAIVKAQGRHKDTFYYPGFWRYIMFAVKAMPEWIFKRLSV